MINSTLKADYLDALEQAFKRRQELWELGVMSNIEFWAGNDCKFETVDAEDRAVQEYEKLTDLLWNSIHELIDEVRFLRKVKNIDS